MGGAAQVVIAMSIFPDSSYSRGPGGVSYHCTPGSPSYPCTPRSASYPCTPGVLLAPESAPFPRVATLLHGIFQKLRVGRGNLQGQEARITKILAVEEKQKQRARGVASWKMRRRVVASFEVSHSRENQAPIYAGGSWALG